MRLFIFSMTTIYIYTSIYGRSEEKQHGGGRATDTMGGTLAPVLDMGTATAIKTVIPFRCGHAPIHILNDHYLYTYIYLWKQ